MSNLIQSVQKLESKKIEALLEQRQADDKALRVLWRAAIARERAERKAKAEREGGCHATR